MSEETPSQVPDPDVTIKNFQGWLHKTASQILHPSSPNLDDLVQEGRLAMWLAMESYKPELGSLPSWLTSKARYHMMTMASKHRWTGQPARMHGRNSAKEPFVDSLDRIIGHRAHSVVSYATLGDMIADPSDFTETADLACHHREIEQARESLTPAQRRYVEARFYDEMTGSEMIEAGVFNYDPSALWNSAKNGAKGKLRTVLNHMADVIS